MVRIRPETTVDQSSVADYPSELSSETPGVIWVKCSHPVVTNGLEVALKTVGYDVHGGHKAPGKDIPSSIIYCPTEEEDVGLEVRALRALSLDAPILVLCVGADPECVLAALQAGACGFIWRQPAESICALSAASEGDTVITMGLLEALLVERASREDCLSPHQQGIIFELAVAASMSSEGALRLPKKLLEAFLGEVMIA
jgi:DNA-binding NarL/FixJ family response regulator